MKKSKWRRYVAAVYLLLLAVAVILGLVALNYVTDESMQSLLLNLSTELAGAVFIFLVVDQIFQLTEQEEQEQLAERLDNLQQNLSSQFKTLYTEREMWEDKDLGVHLSSAKHIQIMGYTLQRSLYEYRHTIIEAINNGAIVNVIIVNNESEGGKLMRHHTCLLYTSPSPRDLSTSRMPSSA